MKIAVISDIHGNWEALKAVIREIDSEEIDQVWCLGDVAGYGPQPNECIDELERLSLTAISGNHDLGVIGSIDLEDFNLDGQKAILWQRPRLSSGSLDYLRRLLLKEKPLPNITLVHGSPRDPVWEYLLTPWLADENFEKLDTTVGFFGHTHLPVIYKKLGDAPAEALLPPAAKKFILENDGARWLINPGSVGQPRDGNPRASYLIFDSEELILEYRRLNYPVGKTQEIMHNVGLPPFLSERLARGI